LVLLKGDFVLFSNFRPTDCLLRYKLCDKSWNRQQYFMLSLLPRLHVSFWLSHILVYLFYFCPSFCLSWDRSI